MTSTARTVVTAKETFQILMEVSKLLNTGKYLFFFPLNISPRDILLIFFLWFALEFANSNTTQNDSQNTEVLILISFV